MAFAQRPDTSVGLDVMASSDAILRFPRRFDQSHKMSAHQNNPYELLEELRFSVDYSQGHRENLTASFHFCKHVLEGVTNVNRSIFIRADVHSDQFSSVSLSSDDRICKLSDRKSLSNGKLCGGQSVDVFQRRKLQGPAD